MSENSSSNNVETMLSKPGKPHSILLTSFRRNGQGIGTPVGMVAADGKLYFMTPAHTWKTRRITNNSHVTLALSTYQGKVLGPAIDGTARQLARIEATQAQKLLRVGFLGWFWNFIFMMRYPGDKTAVYEVSLLSEEQNAKDNSETA